MGDDTHEERFAAFETRLDHLTARVVELEQQLSDQEHTAAAAVVGAIAQQARGGGRRVLIVEDHALMQRALMRALRPLADVVTIVGSVGEALQQEHEHDVGIFDLQLPDGSGLELAQALDVREVFFFTGSDDHALLKQAAALGTVVPKISGAGGLDRLVELLS